MGSSPGTSNVRRSRSGRATRSAVRALVVVLALMLVGVSGFAGASVTSEGDVEGTASVSGRVTAADTGEGLGGIGVEAVREVDGILHRVVATTGGDGSYTLVLDPGTYWLHANAGSPGSILGPTDGALWQYHPVSDEITVGAGDEVVWDAVLPAGPRGSISGTVTDAATGDPVAGVTVTSTFSIFSVSAVTDTLGGYTLSYLPGGPFDEHFVGADGSAVGYSTDTLDGFALGVDEARTGVNLALDALEGPGSISGTVTAWDTGDAVEGVVVVSGRDHHHEASAPIGADGSYTIGGLPTDEYLVVFESHDGDYLSEYYDGDFSFDFSTVDWVTVAPGATVTGIDAVLRSLGTISGRVTAADTGEGLAGVEVRFYDAALWDEGQPVDPPIPWAVWTDEDGNYSAVVHPGRYLVSFVPITHPTYGHVVYDDAQLLVDGTRIHVGSGEGVSGIDAALPNLALGSISGTVTDADTGDPIAGVKVSAISFVDAGEAVTDESGTYTIANLPGQDYTVFFDGTDVGYGTGWYSDDEFEESTLVPLGVGDAVTGIDGVLEEQTVTYTARYAGLRCSTIQNVATGMGLTPAEMIKLGVDGFRDIAEANPGTNYHEWSGTEPTDWGAPVANCEFPVTWKASEVAALESAATWWGATPDQLHDGGGWLVVVLIYRALLGGA